MSDYAKELEAQVEALKAALDKERDWLDYLNKRKDSQKYRRWGIRFLVKVYNIPSSITNKIPLKYSYNETVNTNLSDARDTLRVNLADMVEEYYSMEIPKIVRKLKCKCKGNLAPRVDIQVSIYLFDRRKDKEVFTKVITFSMVYSGKKYGTTVTDVRGHEPGQVHDIDAVILPLIHEEDEYINKWREKEESSGRLRKK